MKTQHYEKCVGCGTVTSERFNTRVEARANYIIGVGQLCDKCFKEIQESKDLK